VVEVHLHHPAGALDRFLVGPDVQHGVPADDLLGLGVRPVGL
jgi:hypothetical protein